MSDLSGGNSNNPESWTAAPAPLDVQVSIGGGVSGSDRVEIVWANGAIQDTWLEVKVLATANTGLATEDVFVWGNKRAKSASAPRPPISSPTINDELAARAIVFGQPSGHYLPAGLQP